MKKVIVMMMLVGMFATTAHAKKLEDVDVRQFPVKVESAITNLPSTVGKVASKTINIVLDVVSFPFKQAEKIAQ